MRAFRLSILLATLFASCSPKISSTIGSRQTSLSDNEFVLVLQKEDPFNNDGIDNGLSTNCTYNEVIWTLKQLAVKTEQT